MFDFSHDFYKPLWIRIAICVFCFGWGLVEFANAAPFWGGVFFAFGALGFYNFFIAKPFEKGEKDD